jgi:beta-glucosidase
MVRATARWRSALVAGALVLGTIPTSGRATAAGDGDERVEALLGRMTLEEKLALVHGDGFKRDAGYAGHIPANERLGIPEIFLADGPNGVGNGSTGVTAFPAAVAAAATWDLDFVRRYGATVGAEQAGKGHRVALAPTVNILRVPEWGRAFETLGEDPFLAARVGVALIEGIQGQGVIATVKHYVANNQEIDRNFVDVQVSERALREVYFPAFRAAVTEAGVGSVMCSYNRLDGPYACEQPWTLDTVLKKEWGFDGFVMSDWFATHSTVAAANAGLDMEMPSGKSTFIPAPEYFGEALGKAVETGEVAPEVLDDKVRRILRQMARHGVLDDKAPAERKDAVVSTDALRQVARDLAERGMVLLRNSGSALPLEGVKSIAVIGDAAGEHAKITGGGSAAVIPSRLRTPLDGIRERAGGAVAITHAAGTFGLDPLPALPEDWVTPPSGEGHGFEVSFFANAALEGAPVATRVVPAAAVVLGPPPVEGLPRLWSARWTGSLSPAATGTYRFSLQGAGRSRLLIGDAEVVSNDSELGGLSHGTIDLQAGHSVPIVVELILTPPLGMPSLSVGALAPDPALLDAAVQAAKAADAAVVFVSDTTTEGSDRTTLALPGDQDALVSAVAAANPRTIVVLNTGGAVLMPWVDEVEGVIEAWYAGQEYGDAIASVLFGDVNPSGRLPITFPARDRQGPGRTPRTFPGVDGTVHYDEGLLVGYRWYDAKVQTPLFPFGHGLSYTTFAVSDLRIDGAGPEGATVTVKVANTGRRAGAEVVQVYLALPKAVAAPPQQLRAFARVALEPGESRDVTLTLDRATLSCWDETAKRWTVPAGTFTVGIGVSSRDIRERGRFTIAE